MRTIEAFWEQRNLGTACREIYLEKNDDADDVEAYLNTVAEAYQVVFVPVERPDLLFAVYNSGFQYIESNFDLVKGGRYGRKVPERYAKILEHVTSRQLEGEETSAFLQNLRNRYFFEKDKISIDPFFSMEMSANRNYWRTKDFLEEGKDLQIYEVSHRDKAIGFYILEIQGKGVIDVYLSGLYPESREMNLGACVMGEETREALRLGARVITAGVSLNNFSCLKLYQSLQYEIKNARNIFIKHKH